MYFLILNRIKIFLGHTINHDTLNEFGVILMLDKSFYTHTNKENINIL